MARDKVTWDAAVSTTWLGGYHGNVHINILFIYFWMWGVPRIFVMKLWCTVWAVCVSIFKSVTDDELACPPSRRRRSRRVSSHGDIVRVRSTYRYL